MRKAFAYLRVSGKSQVGGGKDGFPRQRGCHPGRNLGAATSPTIPACDAWPPKDRRNLHGESHF
jgi:hypothetical protein